METTLLTTDKDPMGAAIADYFNHHKANRLQVFSSQFDEDEIPVRQLYTELIGPRKGETISKSPSYPYIVVKVELRDENVVFE